MQYYTEEDHDCSKSTFILIVKYNILNNVYELLIKLKVFFLTIEVHTFFLHRPLQPSF